MGEATMLKAEVAKLKAQLGEIDKLKEKLKAAEERAKQAEQQVKEMAAQIHKRQEFSRSAKREQDSPHSFSARPARARVFARGLFVPLFSHADFVPRRRK